MSRRGQQLVGLGGLVFVVLVLVSILIAGNSTPDTNASLTKIVLFYQQHRSNQLVSAYLLEVAVVVGVGFFWFLRGLLIEGRADSRLANLGFAGALLFAAGGALAGGLHVTLWDSANSVTASSMQTLNALQNDVTVILSGTGQALLLLATGSVVVTSGVLPRWVGWIAVVLGVLALALPFIGPLWTGIWVLITSIVVLARAGSAARVRVQESPAGAA
jgi:hypothetical protein